MILRRLGVEGWRCFADRLELGPLDERINVVHGPNGSGKSTLVWAMIRGLMDNHASHSEATEALRPDGRRLTPRVTIELEHNGDQFRVAKQFLDSPASTLHRFEGGRWVPMAESRAADEHVRAMLDGSLPAQGLSQEKHWGLAQVLWAPQGKLQLSALASGVAGAIRASLGAQMMSPAANAIESKMNDAYSAIFTDTGRLRSGKKAPEITRLEEQLGQHRTRREKLGATVDQFNEVGKQIRDLAAQRDEIAAGQQRLAESLKAAAGRAETYNRLQSQFAQQKKDLEAAEARWGELNTRVETLESDRKQQRELAEEINQLETLLPPRTTDLERCKKEEAEAAAALAALEQRREQTAQALHAAERAACHREVKRRLENHDKLLRQATDLDGALRDLVERRGRLGAPDAARLRAIRAAVGRREAARAALAAARIRVRIEAENDLDVETDQADSPGRRRVDQGASIEIAGEGIAEFRIAGVGRFRASGPTASIGPLRGELDQAEREVQTLVEGLPTADPTELDQLHEQAMELDRKISAAEARLHGLLDGRTLESLDAERKSLAGTVGQVEAEFGDWAATPPDADALAAGARQMQQQFDADRDALERRGRQCDAAVLAAQSELADVGRRLDDRRGRLENVQQRLAALLGEKNADDAAGDLQDQRRRRAMAAEAARGRLDETQQALSEFTGDPNEEARQIERRVDLARSELQRLREEDSRLKGQLETLQAESPYTALAEADEQIARLEEAIAAERLRNDAIRLLFETFRDCRNEAVEAVFEPVGARATELLRRITGAPLGTVCFTPSFLPEHLVPEGLDRPRSIEETSGGEQEQVHLAVRLALADVLAGDQRQLIVLDDVLTATDSGRLTRVLQLLDEAAERYQMLILTCHPERYQALGKARFFNLKAICQDVLEPRMDTDENG